MLGVITSWVPLLSDELGPVDLKTLRIHPFTRALMLKTNPPASYPLPATTLHTSRGCYVTAYARWHWRGPGRLTPAFSCGITRKGLGSSLGFVDTRLAHRVRAS